MFCANCGKKIEGQGVVCPECVEKLGVEKANALAQSCMGSVPAAAPAAPVYEAPAAPVYQAPAAPVYEAPAAPVYQAPAAPVYQAPAYEAPAYQAPAQAPSQPTPGFTLSSPADGVKKPGKGKKSGKGKKPGKGKLIAIAVIALVLIAGIVLVALNWNNWFGGKDSGSKSGNGKPVVVDPKDIPEDPDDYIAYLHEAQAASFTEGLVKGFYGAAGEDIQGMSVDAKLQVTLGKQVLDLLEDALAESGMNMDVDWLKQISLIINSNVDSKSNQSMNLALAIGKQNILSVDAMVDTNNMVVYMAIPELSKKYIKMDMGEAMDTAAMQNASAVIAELMEDMPSEQEMEKLLNGYMDIIAGYLKGAERQEITLSVGKGSEDVTELTIQLTEEELAEMFQEILEYTRDNKTARKVVQAVMDYMAEMDADEYSMDDFEDFMDEGIEAMKELASDAEDGNYLEIITYANLADIRGYEVRVFSQNRIGNRAYVHTVQEDGKIYVDMQLIAEDLSGSITGTLTDKSGKLSGKLVLESEGEQLGTLELKNVNSDGYGTYVITPGAVLLDELGLDRTISSFLSGVSFELEVKEKGLAVSVVNAEGALITLDISGSTGKASKVTFPSGALDGTDEDDLERWALGMDFGKVLDNLKKAGLPNDLYKALKQMLG